MLKNKNWPFIYDVIKVRIGKGEGEFITKCDGNTRKGLWCDTTFIFSCFCLFSQVMIKIENRIHLHGWPKLLSKLPVDSHTPSYYKQTHARTRLCNCVILPPPLVYHIWPLLGTKDYGIINGFRVKHF